MGIFDINYDTLVWQNMPVRLRKSKHYAWLKCLVSPVVYLYGLFAANRNANLYRLSHDSQVCYLEAILNDLFDNTGRGIFIGDVPYFDPLFLYLVPESKPAYIDKVSEVGAGVIPGINPVPLYTLPETSLTGPSFTINIPSAVTFDTARLRAMVDQYRLPGRCLYNIVTY